MGNGAMAIGHQLPRPSSTLPAIGMSHVGTFETCRPAVTVDASFAPTETLDHNHSPMIMTRSKQGAIEIRYSEPRRALQIEPGTLLFQGQRGGQIQGEAFVFKAGCAPAGYRVTGRRTDGVLVLAGAAPHRGRGCEIVSESTGSKHANLVFNYDPLLNSPDVGSAMSGPQVVTRAQCGQCVPASITSLEGVGTEHATVEARFTRQDIERYCRNEVTGAPSASRLSDCIRENSSELDKTLRAEANCSDLTVKPTSGGSYKFFVIGEDYGGRVPTWTNLATGKVECGARACNGANATSDFALPCPTAIPGWSGRHY
jgi:hypothetical protein